MRLAKVRVTPLASNCSLQGRHEIMLLQQTANSSSIASGPTDVFLV
jgi:hypothetical protein